MDLNPAALPAGEIHLWALFSGPPPDAVGGLPALSAEEAARAARLRRAWARDAFILRRRVLRRLLAAYLAVPPAELRIVADRHGKPGVGGGDAAGGAGVAFSVSQTRGLALLAFAREGALGVDVETLDQPLDLPALAEVALTARERACLAAIAGEPARRQAFLRYWVRKEAGLKATGEGLAVDPARFDAEQPPAAAGGAALTIQDLRGLAGFVAALAILPPAGRLAGQLPPRLRLQFIGQPARFPLAEF